MRGNQVFFDRNLQGTKFAVLGVLKGGVKNVSGREKSFSGSPKNAFNEFIKNRFLFGVACDNGIKPLKKKPHPRKDAASKQK